MRWLLANVSTLAVAWAQLLSPTLLGAAQDVMQSHLCSAPSLLVAAPQSQPGGTWLETGHPAPVPRFLKALGFYSPSYYSYIITKSFCSPVYSLQGCCGLLSRSFTFLTSAVYKTPLKRLKIKFLY